MTPSGSRRHTYYDVTAEETANGTNCAERYTCAEGHRGDNHWRTCRRLRSESLIPERRSCRSKEPYTFNIYADTTVKAEFEKTQEQLIKETNAYNSTIQLIAKSKDCENGKRQEGDPRILV